VAAKSMICEISSGRSCISPSMAFPFSTRAARYAGF
jgi:hypothetical protein